MGAFIVASVAWHAAANAQEVLTRTSSGPACRASTGSDGCDGGGGCIPGEICQVFGPDTAEQARCFPIETIFCCSPEVNPCPVSSASTVPLTCRMLGDSDLSVCLSGHDYCSETPTLAQVDACHTSPDGRHVIVWGNGDCDEDGLANQDEVELGTDYCAAPAASEVFARGACTPLVTGCSPIGSVCPSDALPDDSTCQPSPDGNGTVCTPIDALLRCCRENTDCESTEECVSVGDGVDVCAPALCSGGNPRDCITAPDETIVPAALGDCDRDGIVNGDEQENGTDPCVFDGPDAGTPAQGDAGSEELDASSTEPDAGAPAGDAGASFDGGGTGTPPSFEGGGGCSCRAAPSAPGAAFAWLGLAALALVRRRRR